MAGIVQLSSVSKVRTYVTRKLLNDRIEKDLDFVCIVVEMSKVWSSDAEQINTQANRQNQYIFPK